MASLLGGHFHWSDPPAVATSLRRHRDGANYSSTNDFTPSVPAAHTNYSWNATATVTELRINRTLNGVTNNVSWLTNDSPVTVIVGELITLEARSQFGILGGMSNVV